VTPTRAAAVAVATVLTVAAGSASASPPARGLLLLTVTAPPATPATLPTGPVHLWTLAPRSGAAARDLGPVGRHADQFAQAQLTPDGRHILVLKALGEPVSVQTPMELDELDLAGRRTRTLIHLSGIERFAVSPDASRIVFTRGRPNGADTYLLTVGTRTPTLVRNGWGLTGSFAWLANGKVAVADQWSFCRSLLCEYDPGSGRVARLDVDLSQKPAGVAPTYSPDAKRIAFYSVAGPAGVRVYSLRGGFQRNVAGQYCNGPFSPDGARLVVEEGCSSAPAAAPLLFDFASHRLARLDVRLPFAAGSTYTVADWR
jgi:hypothetical protein